MVWILHPLSLYTPSSLARRRGNASSNQRFPRYTDNFLKRASGDEHRSSRPPPLRWSGALRPSGGGRRPLPSSLPSGQRGPKMPRGPIGELVNHGGKGGIKGMVAVAAEHRCFGKADGHGDAEMRVRCHRATTVLAYWTRYSEGSLRWRRCGRGRPCCR